MNIYSNDTTFYKQIADSDSKAWITSLTLTGILPDNISLKDLQDNAKIYFERTFGKNGEYLLCDELLLNSTDLEEIKKLYIDTFRRSAVLYLNELRAKKLENASTNKKKKKDVALSGKVEAAKWFSAVYDASFARSIVIEDIVNVANITYNILYNQETDPQLKSIFIGAFTQEAKLLFSTLEENALQEEGPFKSD